MWQVQVLLQLGCVLYFLQGDLVWVGLKGKLKKKRTFHEVLL